MKKKKEEKNNHIEQGKKPLQNKEKIQENDLTMKILLI